MKTSRIWEMLDRVINFPLKGTKCPINHASYPILESFSAAADHPIAHIIIKY